MKLFKQVAKYGPVVALTVAAGSAMAALPAGATTVMTDLNADSASLIALMWPIVLTVAGGFAYVTLVKKGVSKAV